jgi:hypothetical protein
VFPGGDERDEILYIRDSVRRIVSIRLCVSGIGYPQRNGVRNCCSIASNGSIFSLLPAPPRA